MTGHPPGGNAELSFKVQRDLEVRNVVPWRRQLLGSVLWLGLGTAWWAHGLLVGHLGLIALRSLSLLRTSAETTLSEVGHVGTGLTRNFLKRSTSPPS
jgi:hypothetical protein